MIIAIPTKGRPGSLPSLDTFAEFGEQIVLIVEPQERDAYASAHPGHRIEVLEVSDRGVAYARNAVMDRFKGRVLMIDDDITEIYCRNAKGQLRESPSLVPMMNAIGECFDKGFAQVTISFRASNWMCVKAWKIGTRCWCFNAVDTERAKQVGARFDECCGVFEDYDFTAQLLAHGLKNISLYTWAFDCRSVGKSTGGVQSFDRAALTEKAKDYLIAKWGPHIVTPRHNDKLNLTEVQFHWKELMRR